MSTRPRHRAAATIAAASLALVAGVAVAPAAAAAPTGSDLDYFSYAFPGLRDDSVFETVTLERFGYLLGSAGTFAFVIGGPADPTTRAAIEHIDAVADDYGVEKVYVFDPRLDGDELDVRTSSIAAIKKGWDDTVAGFLNKDTTPQFGGDPADDPYLFIYDKGHTEGGAEDRVIASLGGTVDAASVATDEGAADYRAQVAAVFDAVAVEGTAVLNTQSHFEFYKNEMNRKHKAGYADASLYGGDIITDADSDWRLRQITYPELLQVLQSDGDHVILFGGTWCHNTRAVVERVNSDAAAADVKTVYQFDLKLDGGNNSSTAWHIRDTGSPLANLYGDLVAQYFPNLRTQYVIANGGGEKVAYYPGGDKAAGLVDAKKLQVPYLIEYDNANAAAPIVQDWIHDNGNGTFQEYMTEYWWTEGLPGKRNLNKYPLDAAGADEAWAAEQQKQWAFADEAVAKIHDFFGLEIPPATVPSAPATPTVTVDGAKATVTWTAPANGGTALLGFRLIVDGGTPIDVPASSTSHDLFGLGVGSHSVTVAAQNHLGTSPASAAAPFTIEEPPVAPEPEPEASVTVTGELKPGGAIVVTGANLPASTPGITVEIRSTPTTLGTAATDAQGALRLEATIPASIAPGAHTVVLLIDGQVVASQAVTVGAAAATGAATGSLPATGGSGIPFAVIGGALVLVLAGTALVIIRRRRAAA